MSIESQTIRIKTREDVSFTPITIYAGQPYYVAPAELAQYFNANNIDISGMSPTEYATVGKLPEGFYTFCFEVVEVTTGQTISNKGCTFAWMNLNEPPMLNLPRKDDKLAPLMPQNIIFNWTPRHTASPGAAYTTTYVLTLVELDSAASTNPEAEFGTSPLLYTDSLNGTTLVYDAGKPQLQVNHKYAWRVQAKSKDGITEIANFKNNGYSEIFWFTYKNTCPLVQGVDTSNVHGYNATINWLADPQQINYKIIYREKNVAKAEWFSVFNNGTQAMLADLKPNTEYEYRVGGACEEGNYNFTATHSFTTKDSTVTAVPDCGVVDTVITTAAQGLQTWANGTYIKAGDFKVYGTNVTGSNGTFSGQGYVPVSYLANMKLAVVFTGITVDTARKLTAGKIETTYDPTEGGIDNLDDYIDELRGGNDVGQVVTGKDTTAYVVNYDIPDPCTTCTFTSNGNGGGTINFGNGQSLVVNAIPTTIKDSNGDIYKVTSNGQVIKIGNSGGKNLIDKANKNNIDSDKGLVTFSNTIESEYAFDKWDDNYAKSSQWEVKYQKIGDYRVAAKAIVAGQADVIRAKVQLIDNTLKIDSVKFINDKGTIYDKKPVAGSSTEFDIIVNAAVAGDATEIYAVYSKGVTDKPYNFGKLLVASYKQKKLQLKIVPVNGAYIDKTSIENKLIKIYKPIGILWDVSVDDNFQDDTWDSDGNGILDAGSTGFFSTITDEMRGLNGAYKSKRGVDKNTIYLFALDQEAIDIEGATVLGDMPRGKQFGYVFTHGNNIEKVAQTAAHELGHGALQLLHTFSYGKITKGLLTPPNVMDYPAGEYLAKHQWDMIHDQGIVIGLFESDKSALYKQNVLVIEQNGFDVEDGDDLPPPPPGPITKTFYFDDNKYVTIQFNVPVKVKGNSISYTTPPPNSKTETYSLLWSSSTRKFSAFFLDDDLAVTKSTKTDDGTTTYENTSNVKKFGTINYTIIAEGELLQSSADMRIVLQQRKDLKKRRTKLERLVKALNNFSLPALNEYLQNPVFNPGSPCGGIVVLNDYTKTYSDACWDYLITQLEDRVNAGRAKCLEIVNLINVNPLTGTTKSTIKNKFRELSSVEYGLFTANERLLLLSYFVTGSMGGTYFRENEESFALQIIKNVDNKQANDVMTGLEAAPMVMNDVTITPEFTGSLFYNLHRKVDDGIFLGVGGENYTELIKALIAVANSSSDFATRFLDMVATDNFENRIMNWGEAEGVIRVRDVTTAPNGNLIIEREELTTKFIDAYWPPGVPLSEPPETPAYWATGWFSSGTVELKPFDLVMFANYSSLSSIDDVNGKDKGVMNIVPAIVLKYAQQKNSNEEIKKTIQYTIDGLVLVSGVGTIASGAFKALSWGKKAWTLFNIVNAATNIAINANDWANDPDMSTAVGIYNGATLLLNTIQLFNVSSGGGPRNFSNTVSKIKNGVANGFAGIKTISKSQATKLFSNVVNVYKKISEGNLNLTAQGRVALGKLKEYCDQLRSNWKGMFKESAPSFNIEGSLLTNRIKFWENWINKCFPRRDFGATEFKTFGKNYNEFKTTNTVIYNDMKALVSDEAKLQEVIESGSTIPEKIPINHGDEFYKIVPKNPESTGIRGRSPYYIDKTQLDIIKANPSILEQELGLPLSSVSQDYDVYKITYQGNGGYVFKSTTASTEQFAKSTPNIKYITSGGGTQTLILDNFENTQWLKSLTPVESIIPNQLPQIGN